MSISASSKTLSTPPGTVQVKLPVTAECAARLAKQFNDLAFELVDQSDFGAEADVHEWPDGARVQFLRS